MSSREQAIMKVETTDGRAISLAEIIQVRYHKQLRFTAEGPLEVLGYLVYLVPEHGNLIKYQYWTVEEFAFAEAQVKMLRMLIWRYKHGEMGN